MTYVVAADLANGHGGFVECDSKELAEEIKREWESEGLANGRDPIVGEVEIRTYHW